MDSSLSHPVVPEADPLIVFSALATLNSMSFSSFSEATRAYLEFAMRAVGVRSAFLANLTPEIMYVLDSRTEKGCDIPRDGIFPIEETFCQYVRTTGAPVQINDASQDVRVKYVSSRIDCNIGSYLGVPMNRSDGSMLGTLCTLDPDPHAFSQYHVDLLCIVARHLSLLIECQYQTQINRASEKHLVAAERAREAQSAMLNIVAHDLRNPLSGIQGHVELIRRGFLGSLTQLQQESLDIVLHSAQYANRLVTDLVDVAAAETTTLSVLSNLFHPEELGRSVLETCRFQAADRDLQLQLDCAPTLPMVIGDADRTRQVLLNYLGNAIRYTGTGQITLRIHTVDSGVQFTVADTGPGISLAAQDDVWNIYQRNSREGQGLGLGLYIVKRLADAMGGSVGVNSQPGNGSQFWLRLPVNGQPPRKVAFVVPAA